MGIGEMITTYYLLKVLKWLFFALIAIVGLYFVIRAICRYQAKENARAFDYDYLAERTAAEICKRLAIMEKQKTAYKGANNGAGDQTDGNREGEPEQNGSQQA